jgi:hypothetical protein
MRTPNLTRVVETFIDIGRPNDANRMRQRYFDLLSTQVLPTISKLQTQGYVGWFSFLVHNRETGRIPIEEGDGRCFIHLRVERLPRVSVKRIRESLPKVCEHTRPMSTKKIDCSLGAVDTSALLAPEIPTGWRLFGISSEWVLQLVSAHRPGQPIPKENLCQFFHYIQNQLLVETWVAS